MKVNEQQPTSNIYNKILEAFVDLRPGAGREWKGKPFVIGEKAIATDSCTMVIVPASKAGGIELLTEFDPDSVLKAIPGAEFRGRNIPVPMALVKDKTQHLAKKPEIILKDCEACDADGWVVYEFIHKDIRHTKDGECPICAGEGDLFAGYTGRDIYDSSLFFKVVDCVYSAKLFDKALYAANLLGVDKIIFTRQEPTSCTVIEFRDVEILLMPVVKKDFEDDEQLITIL